MSRRSPLWAPEYYLSVLANRVSGRFRGLRRRIKTAYENNRVASLRPEGPSKGDVLLSYIVQPFLLKPDQPVPYWHPNHTESLLIARTFLDLGYSVDVIAFTNEVVPKKDYAFLIDSRRNLERHASRMDEQCVKILHSDTAHMLFHNAAESRRLLQLQQRKGVTLRPRRFEQPNLAIEHADCGVILGNEFTLSTFRYAGKPLYRVPVLSTVRFPWPAERNIDACRRRFLWLGSGGLVHKGLDLVLEAFAKMPDYHLTVCGPIDKEKDFERAYSQELYDTPNIRTVGWVDIKSPAFAEIAGSCLGLVFASCCEGQSGSVVTGLHAGLVPIISYESGVDVDDFGVILRTSTVEEISEAVTRVSELPVSTLRAMSRQAWEQARARHTPEQYAVEYRQAIDQIVQTHGRQRPGAP